MGKGLYKMYLRFPQIPAQEICGKILGIALHFGKNTRVPYFIEYNAHTSILHAPEFHKDFCQNFYFIFQEYFH